MYTSYIGKKFLTLYNEKQKTELSAKDFFNEILFPLFFDDNKHLMHVGNSPFFQKPKQREGMTKSQSQLADLHEKIASDPPNMSIFVGFAAKDVQGTTSGQVTDIDFKIEQDEMYASWIGQALAIGVKGGFVMLFPTNEVLWNLFEGWKYYRQFIQQTPNVKDKQIETWNGYWICNCFDKKYDPNHPYDSFPKDIVEKGAISTIEWVKVIFALSAKYSNKTVLAYAYSLSQTNTTLGFINIQCPNVRRLHQFRDIVFIDSKSSILKEKEINELFETNYSFKSAFQLGVIGLKALEPKKIRDFMPKGSMLFAQGKTFKLSDKSYETFHIYRLWIIAMLNKTELLSLATKVAQTLIDLKTKDERGKKVLSQLAEEVRESSNIKVFIAKLTGVLEKMPENADILKNVVEQVLKMPSDNFPLFITLVRFECVYLESKK